MKLSGEIVAYEIAHNMYMRHLCELDLNRYEWDIAYKTIKELLGLNNITCYAHLTLCEDGCKIIVFIDGERFDFSFAY